MTWRSSIAKHWLNLKGTDFSGSSLEESKETRVAFEIGRILYMKEVEFGRGENKEKGTIIHLDDPNETQLTIPMELHKILKLYTERTK